jgi:hypothetical protein
MIKNMETRLTIRLLAKYRGKLDRSKTVLYPTRLNVSGFGKL